MDGVIVIILSVVLYFVYYPKKQHESIETSQAVERIEENPMLNPEMIHDENAFMEIANELGFH